MKIEVEVLCGNVVAVYQKPDDEDTQCVILDDECVAQILHHLYPELSDKLGTLSGSALRARAERFGALRLVA